MSDLPAERPRDDPEALALRKDAQVAVEAAKAMLSAAVFERQVPLALLTKIATDPSVPPREQRRAAEVLAHLQVKLIETVASVTGAREQRLQDLGIETPATEVNVTQVHQQIEIVREGTRDWRALERG